MITSKNMSPRATSKTASSLVRKRMMQSTSLQMPSKPLPRPMPTATWSSDKALADAVRATKVDGVTGAISFGADGDRPPESTNVVIYKGTGGKWVQVFPAP
jgi:ABC-type branched-subunit amino acid transport system substrate-binding protein